MADGKRQHEVESPKRKRARCDKQGQESMSRTEDTQHPGLRSLQPAPAQNQPRRLETIEITVRRVGMPDILIRVDDESQVPVALAAHGVDRTGDVFIFFREI